MCTIFCPCGLRVTGPAAVHDGNSGEDADGSQKLHPGEAVHADGDAHGRRDDGLQVAVHAHQCGADALLPQRDEEVGDEGGKEDEVAHLPPHFGWHGTIVEGDHLACREGQRRVPDH